MNTELISLSVHWPSSRSGPPDPPHIVQWTLSVTMHINFRMAPNMVMLAIKQVIHNCSGSLKCRLTKCRSIKWRLIKFRLIKCRLIKCRLEKAD